MPFFRSTWTSGCSMYEQDARNITVLPAPRCSSAVLRMAYSARLYVPRGQLVTAPSSGARQILLRLAPGHLLDQALREPVDGARHAIALLQDDLVVVRNVRIEERLRRGAGERIDGLVVVARHDEVLARARPTSGPASTASG